MSASQSLNFFLTSKSEIKIQAVADVLKSKGVQYTLFSADDGVIGNVEQPIGLGGLVCAKNRILDRLQKITESPQSDTKFDAIIAVESSFEVCKSDPSSAEDVVNVLFYDCSSGRYFYDKGSKEAMRINKTFFDVSKEKSKTMTPLGWDYTVGQVLADNGLATNPKNWMLDLFNYDRKTQMTKSINRCYDLFMAKEYTPNELLPSLGFYTDFKKDVLFQDLGPVLSNWKLLNTLVWETINTLRRVVNADVSSNLHYIVGIEARGFYLAPIIARELSCGFIPIRKSGKLPGTVLQSKYTTEYSIDAMEIQKNCFSDMRAEPEINIVIVDDLLATGGSLEAACKLVTQTLSQMQYTNRVTITCLCPLYVPELLDVATKRLKQSCGVDVVTVLKY